jgi:nitrogen fixation/metabolism regulation signal transduction histidine kinase
MGFNRFYINIILNVILIVLGCFGMVYFGFHLHQIATGIVFAIICMALTGRLIHYLNRTNRMLDQFLNYMREQDPTILLSSKFVTSTFTGFYEKLQQIANELKKERLEKEGQARYLQALLEHAMAGIISIEPTGRINLINKSALNYLGITRLLHLNELQKIIPGMGQQIESLNPDHTLIKRVFAHGDLRYLSFRFARIKIMGRPYTIVIFHDIKNELEEQEIESWKKLLRVITHEIMNSLTPIVNLTSALKKELRDISGRMVLPDEKSAIQSLELIEERSRGIIHFISQYKKITKLPPLKLTEINMEQMFDRLQFLFMEQTEHSGIRLSTILRHNKPLIADKNMIEQVLINLVKNAIEATVNMADPQIELHSFLDATHRIRIEVRDNGKGIPDKFKDQVFIPFFTTKNHGSGIGLSLSRQIMRLHKGDINLISKTARGTSVQLIF